MQLALQKALTQHSEAVALAGASRRLTYRELDAVSRQYASHLQELGVKPGDRVGLLLPRSPELIIAMVAAWRCGAAYTPIDTNSPTDRTGRILQVSQPRVVVTRPELAIKLPDDTPLTFVDHLEGPSTSNHSEWSDTPAGGAAYVLFTSGSTGLPKGVEVGPAGLARLLIDNPWADFPAGSNWLQVTSPAFDISNVEIWGCLLHGGTLHLLESALPSLDELADTILQKKLTHVQLSTAVFNALVDTRLDCLSGVKQMISGGERASPSHMHRVISAHPDLRLINGYGPTETTIYSLTHTVTLACTALPAGIPIGVPVEGTRVRLDTTVGGFDRSDTGELLIGGEGLAHGYLGDPDQTARRFIHLEGERWYRTGDLARRREDGCHEYLGRIDRQVKLQGQRIEIDEVELALGQCPGVGEVAVLLRDQDPHNKHLAAFYSSEDDTPPPVDIVVAHLTKTLLPAAMPKVLRCLQRLPVNLNGKVDRQALAALLAPSAGARPDQAPVHWNSKMEETLAGVWATFLPDEALTPESNLLRIGGTSLTALQLSARIRQDMGRAVSPAQLLLHPVLADQAQLIGQARMTQSEAGPSAARHDNTPETCVAYALTRGQAALLAASTLDSTGAAYLVHLPLWFDAAIEPKAWQGALTRLAARHPLMRLRGQHSGLVATAAIGPKLADGWWRDVNTPVTQPIDLDWPADLVDTLNQSMPPEKGMFRVTHWPHGSGGCLVVLTFHHAIVDDNASDLVLQELNALIQEQPLPPGPQIEHNLSGLEAGLIEPRGLSEWAHRLAMRLGSIASPPLPLPPAQGDERSLPMPPAIKSELSAACHQAGCTPFPALLTAYGLALQDVFGEAFAFVSTPFSRKTDSALQNTLCYLLDVRFIETGRSSPDEDLLSTFSRVQQATLDALRPQFQPLDALSHAVASLSPTAAQALTQFGFTWRINPMGARPIGHQTAELLRVPQTIAKYAFCLHVVEQEGELLLSVEAAHQAFAGGQVKAVHAAFLHRLQQLVTRLAVLPSPLPSTTTMPAHPAISQYLKSTQRSWNRSLGLSEDTKQTLEAHYLRSGGTSLSAMRMAAELRKQHGLKIDLVAFLKQPTLGALVKQATPDHPDCVVVGPQHPSGVLLLIPGLGGHAVGMLKLAECIQSGLPGDQSVVILELDAILSDAPTSGVLDHTLKRMQATLGRLPQVVGIMGYSMGGLLAIHALQDWPVGQKRPPLLLLDTYAPRAIRHNWLRKLETSLSRRWLGRPDDRAAEIEEVEPLTIRAQRETWTRLLDELLRHPLPELAMGAHQISAVEMEKYVGLLWRRRTFGFAPRCLHALQTHRLPGHHLELPNRLAPEVAQLVCQTLATYPTRGGQEST